MEAFAIKGRPHLTGVYYYNYDCRKATAAWLVELQRNQLTHTDRVLADRMITDDGCQVGMPLLIYGPL